MRRLLDPSRCLLSSLVSLVLASGRCVALAAPPPAEPPRPAPAAYREGLEAIGERQLRSWVGFLAASELEGRESGARGYDIAARYVASVLEEIGAEPAGDGGTYFQGFTLVRRFWDLEGGALVVTPRVAVGGAAAAESLPLAGNLALGVRGGLEEIAWGGRWVLATPGGEAPVAAGDVLGGLPREQAVVLFIPRDGEESTRRITARFRSVERLVVVSDRAAKRGMGITSSEEPEYLLEKETARTTAAGGTDAVYITRALADRILAPCGTSVEKVLAAPAGQPPLVLDAVDVKFTLKKKETRRPTRNVVARLEGSDPAFRAEHVAIGAHLDHIGTRDDKVYFGADDDASGCAAVLGAARAFALNPARPRRSIYFLFFAAEEKGLYGSGYFVDHPVTPLEKLVVLIQLDMVGRDEEVRADDPAKAERAADNVNSVHVVGAKRHSLELDPWIQRVNDFVRLDFEYDEERVYTRSDQIRFGERNVPVVFFFGGFHPDYHQPTDTPEKINYAKLARITRLVFGLAYEVADRERRLTNNRL